MGTMLATIRIWIPAMLFASGALLIAAAVATGEAEVSLVVIFPVFTGSSWLFALGILLIIAGFFAFFFSMLASSAPAVPGVESALDDGPRTKKTSYGGVVLIGPIPIAFGSDRRTAMIMLAIGLVALAVFVGLFIITMLVA